MRNAYVASRNLPLELLPNRQRGTGAQAIADHDARERKNSDERSRKIGAVLENGQRQLRDKLGAKNVAALREAMLTEKRALQILREPPGGLALDLARANKVRKKRVDTVLRKLGIDPAMLQGIRDATHRKLTVALGEPAGSVTSGANLHHNLAKWQALSPLHQYPLDWGVRPPYDPTDPGQFEVFGPDFPLWNYAFDSVESHNFVVRREQTIYESSGVVANVATMDCNDAGSFDLAQAIVDTEVVFVYEAPRAGRLEVIIDAMNAFGHHDLSIEDEVGWSEHWTHQRNYLSLQVFHPNIPERSLALMSDFYKEGNDDAEWRERALTPGNHYYGHLLSEGTVEAGDTFFVGVGTRTFDQSRANDVEVHSKSHFQWWVRSAEVRIVV